MKGEAVLLKDTKPSVILPYTVLVLGFSVVFFTICSVFLFSNPVYFWDQWDNVWVFRKFVEGHLSLGDLFQQHNEHRIFFPRLIFIADFIFSNSDNKINFLVNFLIQFSQVFILYLLFCKLNNNKYMRLAYLGFCCALLFSLYQWENFFWGFQVQFFGVTAAALASFFFYSKGSDLQGQGRSPWVEDTLSFFMALIACFSLSNGFLASVLLVFLAILQKRTKKQIAMAALFCCILIFSYFHDFQAVSSHASYRDALQHPIDYIAYFSTYMGNVFAIFGAKWFSKMPLFVGMLGIISTLLSVYWSIFQEKNNNWRGGWVAGSLFVLGTAALTSLGRMNFGLEQALSYRYTSPTSVFWCCQIGYWSSLYVHTNKFKTVMYGVKNLVGIVGVLLFINAVKAETIEWNLVRYRHVQFLASEDALLSNVLDEDQLKSLFANVGSIKENIPFVRNNSLNIYSHVENRLLGSNIFSIFLISSGDACIGHIDIANRVVHSDNADDRKISGWAWNLNGQTNVNRIFLTDDRDRVIGYASGGISRPDVLRAVDRVKKRNVGWSGYANISNNQTIKAYALLDHRTICSLGQYQMSAE